jgi:transposase
VSESTARWLPSRRLRRKTPSGPTGSGTPWLASTQQTTIINRIKATLTRLGIRNFNPKLKKAPERLEHLHTPESEPIPQNTLAELRRDMERRRLVAEQIRQIEKARLEYLEQARKTGPSLMVCVLARVIGIGIDTADMLVHEIM